MPAAEIRVKRAAPIATGFTHLPNPNQIGKTLFGFHEGIFREMDF